jgi:hypothetical protein
MKTHSYNLFLASALTAFLASTPAAAEDRSPAPDRSKEVRAAAAPEDGSGGKAASREGREESRTEMENEEETDQGYVFGNTGGC